jgi:repressor LexA
MINAGIFHGDYVVVRQQEVASNGDFVVALLDDEVTVKTYMYNDGHIWLIPQNPSYAPILADNATIIGRVVTVLRRV